MAHPAPTPASFLDLFASAPRHVPTWGDAIVVLALIGLLAWSLPTSSPAGALEVQVLAPDGWQRVLPLAGEHELDAPGRLGAVRLRIDEQGVRCLHATCPNRRCMRMGPARSSGQGVICVPNGVAAMVRGGQAPPYDALSR